MKAHGADSELSHMGTQSVRTPGACVKMYILFLKALL